MPTVLITGANRGIGLEFARQYAEAGATVFAVCRDPENAADLKALREKSSLVEIFKGDVADGASIDHLKAEIGAAPIDILINNAGVFGGERQSLSDMDYGVWEETLNINTLGPFRIIAAFADNVAASTEKKIAVISSGMGGIAEAGGGHYAYRTSKAAVNMVVKCAAADLRDQQVIVLALCPGWVQTAMGGPTAAITSSESVTGLRKVIAGARETDSGAFARYNGMPLAW